MGGARRRREIGMRGVKKVCRSKPALLQRGKLQQEQRVREALVALSQRQRSDVANSSTAEGT